MHKISELSQMSELPCFSPTHTHFLREPNGFLPLRMEIAVDDSGSLTGVIYPERGILGKDKMGYKQLHKR